MRKLLLGLAALLGFAAQAHADDLLLHPYIGMDYHYTGVDYANVPGTNASYDRYLEDSLNGFNIHAGLRFLQYFGAEAAYVWTEDGTRSFGFASTTVHQRGGTLDAMGYLPVPVQGVELIGTMGFGIFNDHFSGSAGTFVSSSDKEDTAFRVGGGAQYALSEQVGVRALVRYQTSSVSQIDDAVVVDAGINYQF